MHSEQYFKTMKKSVCVWGREGAGLELAHPYQPIPIANI